MGKSGGGWTTTVSASLDPRIHGAYIIFVQKCGPYSLYYI